jgi:hypothetical protein
VLDNNAEASGVVGHNTIDAGSDQGTEIAVIVNRPDNKAHTRPARARGVNRITPPQFRHDKILP